VLIPAFMFAQDIRDQVDLDEPPDLWRSALREGPECESAPLEERWTSEAHKSRKRDITVS